MELVLLAPVKALGNVGDIVKVSRGYASNFLLPQGKAIFATPEEKQKAVKLRETRKVSHADTEVWVSDAVSRLTGKTLLFTKKVSSAGKLFGSVAEKDIIARVEEEYHVQLETSHIRMGHHIKDLGDHSVEIHLAEGKSINLTVRVEGEK